MLIRILAVCLVLGSIGSSTAAVLARSDVVFMYQAEPEVYHSYGATALAWGGKPSPESLRDAAGLKFFGSVGMVTEFSRYYERFPQSYEQGLCRDIDGQPVKVPWLTDHQHKGVPFWWCCTQQPQFRQYLIERVTETVKSGATGVHIDDHLGSAGGLWLGLCFCDRCVEGFRIHLKALPSAELRRLGIEEPGAVNYREMVRSWVRQEPSGQRKPVQHPLWPQWTVYQCRAAAAFMQELRSVAERVGGRPVPIGANAGLLWPRHLVDYRTLDLFSAETDHHAQQQRFSDLPLFAYRLADAVERPYAATASGGDWAYIKEHNVPGLVEGWIALGYAAGQLFMAPHRQWCYTPEKGTHWYNGPTGKFAPLYQFVRQNASILDPFDCFADVAVVLPHRAFLQNANRWFDLCHELASHNVSYRLLLGGDDLVDHALTREALAACPALLVPNREDLLPQDRQTLETHLANHPGTGLFTTSGATLAALKSAVRVDDNLAVRVLPRVATGAAAIHFLNLRYDPARDGVTPLRNIAVQLELKALGLSGPLNATFFQPGGAPQALQVTGGTLNIPELGLWGIVVLRKAAPSPP